MKKPLHEQMTLQNIGITCLVVLSIVLVIVMCGWGCNVFLDQTDNASAKVDAAVSGDAQEGGAAGDEEFDAEPSGKAGEAFNEAAGEQADSEADSAEDAEPGEESAASDEEAAEQAEAEKQKELQHAIDEGNIINTWQLPDSTYIYETSIDDLMNADAYFDGQSVQITGEAVGDALLAGTNIRHRWVTVESETGAFVSVYMSEDQAALIDTFGSYDKVGTTLQIRGNYHLVCQDHQGESDIHAESVVVVAVGQDRHDEYDPFMFLPGTFALLLGGALMGAFAVIRNKRR